MRKLLEKFLKFLMVSGLGWMIDFALFTLLMKKTPIGVAAGNYLSSFAAVCFVFTVSTRKILLDPRGGRAGWKKFLLYVLYQLVLVTAVSFLAQWLHLWLYGLPLLQPVALLRENTKLLAKILITPITLIMNFFVLKRIVEGGRTHGEG